MTTKKRFTEDSFRREPWFQALCQALLSPKNADAMANMLRDIGALSELQAWSERLEVAKQLAKGLSYRQVAAVTGASTTTVTRVARSLENGTGGLRDLLHTHRHHEMRKNMIKKVDQEIPQNVEEKQQLAPSETKPVSLVQKHLFKK